MGVRKLEQDAGAVARAGVATRGTPMGETAQNLDSLGNDVV